MAAGHVWRQDEAGGRGADRPASLDVAVSARVAASPDGPASLDVTAPFDVTELDGRVLSGSDCVVDVLALVVNRLFGIGLDVQSAAGMAAGPVAARLQLVVDGLDDLVREARSVAFERLRQGSRAG